MTTGNVEEMGREVPVSSQQKIEYASANFWKSTVAKVCIGYESNRQKFLKDTVLIAQLRSDPQCANAALHAAHEKYSEEMGRLPQKDLIILENLAQFMNDLIEITSTATDPKSIQKEKKAVMQNLQKYRSAQIAQKKLEKGSVRSIGESVELELMKGKVEGATVKPQEKSLMVEKVFKDLASKLWGQPKTEAKVTPDIIKGKISALTKSIKALYANAEWEPLQVEAMKKAYNDLAEVAKIAPEAKDELKNLWNVLAETGLRNPQHKPKMREIMRTKAYQDAAKIFLK